MERDLIIPSQLTYINEVRHFLEKIFIDSDLNKAHFNRIFLGLSEAVCNSIVHGNRLNVDKNVFVHVLYSEKKLMFEVTDEGDGFSVDRIDDPTLLENLKKENGRGIFLIQQIADEVVFSEGGRKVVIRFSFD